MSFRHLLKADLFNMLAEISRTPSVPFRRDVRVNSYLKQLWTTVAQRPHKL